MANQPQTATWETGVFQWETSTPALGGPGGPMNTPLLQLANRTLYLKGQIEASSGVTAGTWPKVTVNARGMVTAGANLAASDIPGLPWSKITSGLPTTLEGYGITDALSSVDGLSVDDIPGLPWSKITSGLPTTLEGYGILANAASLFGFSSGTNSDGTWFTCAAFTIQIGVVDVPYGGPTAFALPKPFDSDFHVITLSGAGHTINPVGAAKGSAEYALSHFKAWSDWPGGAQTCFFIAVGK